MRPIYTKLLLLALVLAGLFGFLWALGPLVKILIVSMLLAYVLDPVAGAFESRGLSRTSATAIIFLGLGLIIVTIGLYGIPAMIQELQSLQGGDSTEQTERIVGQLQTILAEKLSFLGLEHFNLAGMIETAKNDLSQSLLDYLVTDGAAFLTHLVALPFIIFFLIKDGREMKAHLLSVIPNRYFEFTLNLMAKTDNQLGSYLRGQFLDATVFCALSTTAMWFLDVRYFLFIGIFAGVANLIPYVGPLAGAILATSITVFTTGDFVRVGYVLIAFIIAKLLDDSFVQPMIVARSVHMHPLLVLLVVIIGGEFFGILGMLLSVPATGVLRVAVSESIVMLRRYNISTST